MTLDESWSRPRVYPIGGDGTITTHSLEVHVTDHCNLRCAGCCVLSPLAARRFLSKEGLIRDLALARAVLRPSIFKLSGGEPLLAPEIAELASLAKASAIAPCISMATNGVLLARAPDALFEALDAITISIYPDVGIDEDHLARVRERAARFGVALNEKRQDAFQAMTRKAPATDAAVVRGVFETCWLRHRCHTLRDGMLYACSRPPGLAALARPRAGEPREAGEVGILQHDGISLAPRTELARDVARYLERAEPLASCTHCLGGSGVFKAFRQLTRAEVRARSPE
jgi:cyclic pyranopterin phosphate synthase